MTMRKIKACILSVLIVSSASANAATYTVPVTVTTWSETRGQALLQWAPSEAGYRAWYRGGWNQYFRDYLPGSGCKDADVSDYSMTPCMIKAMFDAAERSVSELGLDVKFAVTIRTEDSETDCKDTDCLHAIVDKHVAKSLVDVVMIPVRNGAAQGYTRSTATASVIGLHLGKQWAPSALHLLRHELAHALGFNGHLYDTAPFTSTARPGFCDAMITKPYSQSGLPQGCVNNTFLGSWIKPGEICTTNSMNDQKEFDEKYNVPVYGDQFRAIFACYLRAHFESAPIPIPPKPTPPPCTCPK